MAMTEETPALEPSSGRTYEQRLLDQARPAERPEAHEGLLFEPVTHDPYAEDASYADWEFDHAAQRRFRVGGILWFFRTTSLTVQDFSLFYRDRAVASIAETGWTAMPNSGRRWTEPIARTQFLEARRGLGLYFQKAALIIRASELALTDMIADGRVTGFESGLEVYRHMSIIPCVWNVDDFNADLYGGLSPDERGQISDHIGQGQTLLSDLATGYCVTSASARLLKNKADEMALNPAPGRVRAKPGNRKLGRQKASDFETVATG